MQGKGDVPSFNTCSACLQEASAQRRAKRAELDGVKRALQKLQGGCL